MYTPAADTGVMVEKDAALSSAYSPVDYMSITSFLDYQKMMFQPTTRSNHAKTMIISSVRIQVMCLIIVLCDVVSM